MSTCPNCGQEHPDGWVPPEDIQRDLAAMVALVLSEDASIPDFLVLLGDLRRAPELLLHAVQTIAFQGATMAHMNGEEDPDKAVLEFLQHTLLTHYAKGGDDEAEGRVSD